MNEQRTANAEAIYTDSFGREQRAILLRQSSTHAAVEAWDISVMSEKSAEHIPGVRFSPDGGATTFRMGTAAGTTATANSTRPAKQPAT